MGLLPYGFKVAATAATIASSYYHSDRKKEEGTQKICFPFIREEKLSQKLHSRPLFKPYWSELGHMTTCKGGCENVYQEEEFKSQDGFTSVITHPPGIEWRVGILPTQTFRVLLARKRMGMNGNKPLFVTIICFL